ncbi:MAG: hypothetical protein II919_03095 [Lachnospiraceae bacterium]|nr:hypothetical protein [Lachnospiraceae bacterium]
MADGVLVHNKCDIDKEKVKEDSENHIFSDKHVKGGIMDLGTDKDSIMDEGLKIIENVDSKYNLGDGPLQIRTHINNFKAEIRIFIKNGKLINFNMFKGWSVEIKKNSIEW